MTLIIPCSTSSISLIPGTALTINKNNRLNRFSLSRKPGKHTLCLPRLVLRPPTFVTLIPKYRGGHALLHRSVVLKVSATGTDVAVEEPNSPVLDENSGGALETSADSVEPNETSTVKSDATPAPAQSRRSRPGRKSEMPPVKNEDLVPGTIFTGKVRSIQPFGAFIDFGAFTEGLVHVSQLSDSFVKDVASVVSIGQEVKVRLVEANTETGRISLSMRESDDSGKLQQRKDGASAASSDKPRPSRRNTPRPGQRKEDIKSSKFVKGQDLEGTVKNLTRSGAFISLPEGEEGFLPLSEESDDGLGSIIGASSLEVGQEVSVRVLRITRGQVTLTMKKEEDNANLELEYRQGVVHAATNPFMLAFRRNKDIAAFLDEREKVEKAAKRLSKPKISEEIGGQVSQVETISDIPLTQDQPASSDESLTGIPSAVVQNVKDDETEEKEGEESAVVLDPVSVSTANEMVEAPLTDLAESEDKQDSSGEITSQVLLSESLVVKEVVESQPSDSIPENEVKSEEKADSSREITSGVSSLESLVEKVVESQPSDSIPENEVKSEEKSDSSGEITSGVSLLESLVEEVVESQPSDSIPENEVKNEEKSDSSGEITSQVSSSESLLVEEVVESQPGDFVSENEVESQALDVDNDILSAVPVEENSTNATLDENGSVNGSTLQPDPDSLDEAKDKVGSNENSDPSEETSEAPILSAETEAVEEVVENLAEITKDEVQIQVPAAETAIPSATQFKEKKEELAAAKNESFNNSNGQSGGPPPAENVSKATISPALVKQLREETGAGMMDCKKALSETGGDIVKAQEFLRKKGLASAEKKASRTTAEGRIGSYIHDSRIGVLIEVNCETDFVSRGDIFKELVDDLAMQVAACPQVQYLVTEDVPEDIVNKERDIEMQKEDLLSKPVQIRSRIVEGRIKKRLEELALLEQPYIKNDKLVVKDWVKQTIATIGENIKVKRFVRYNLGEGLEKKSQDFAAEVAAQTAAKPAAAPPKEQPAVKEAKDAAQKPEAVAVSAALVKQLREDTGAGMMDCKKALSETGGDLVKAQEYLRKKGLSTADKKSSRLAAEGRIGSYIHDSRIGVLIEVNSETDFVGRSEKFKELVDDLAMQVVACPQVQFVSIEDISESILEKEKELEMQREDLLSKPENIREKIVEGRVSKRLGELALLEQPFIKDDSLLVKDLVKQAVAALGENIKVRRFVRFTLGETIVDAKIEREA